MSATMFSTGLKPASGKQTTARSPVVRASTKVLKRGTQTKTKEAAPMVLTRIEKIGLLSKLEQAGVLSLLEKSGITLEFIEKNKLLSKAESVGAVGLLVDRNTPTTLTLLGIFLLCATAGTLLFVPDSSQGVAIAKSAGSVAMAGAAGAAILGGAFVAELQKDRALW